MNRLAIVSTAGALLVTGVVLYPFGFAAWMSWSSLDRRAPVDGLVATVAQPQHVRFVALGDAGEDNASNRLVAQAIGATCAQRGCDFALNLGDNLYRTGMDGPNDARMDQVSRHWAAWPFPTYLVLGNHDYNRGLDRRAAHWQVDWALRTDGFHLPSPVYSFNAGHALFLALDTTEVFWQGAQPQADWVDAQLAASDAPWSVAFGHHTFRSEAGHGDAGSYDSARGVPWADGAALNTLFEQHLCAKVDLVLAGHDHNRQWIESCGTAVIVSGAGSKTRPLVRRSNPLLFGRAEEGFVWIELGPERMTVAFYDERGVLEFEAQRDRAGRVWVADEPQLFWDPSQGLLGTPIADYPETP